MKIAIIEDEPSCLHNMQEVLVGVGHDVLAVLVEEQDVRTIADTVNGFKPDAVILDHMLSEQGEKLGSEVAPMLSTPHAMLISSSTTGRKPYCRWVFEHKDDLSPGCAFEDVARRKLIQLMVLIVPST